MRIGYVGLGAMGGALAARLLRTHPLTVWDLRAASVEALAQRGAAPAASAADLARGCDIVMLCLPRTSDVRAALLGDGGIADALAPGALIVDQTSGVPGETRAIAEALAARRIAMIDAPVSGGIGGAAAGTIAIMASGPEEHYARARPILSAISPNVFHCGGQVGQGQAMKSVNNLMSAGCRVATLEIVAMGRKMGLPLGPMVDCINAGSGRNRTSKVMLKQLAEGKEAKLAFLMSLMVKDFNQAIALGMECGAAMPIANVVRGLLQAGVNMEGEGAQLDAIMPVIERMAGVRIVAGDAP